LNEWLFFEGEIAHYSLHKKLYESVLELALATQTKFSKAINIFFSFYLA